MSKRLFLILASLGLAALIIIPNARSLCEGIFFYLRDVVTFDPRAVKPVSRDGRYASVYELVRLQNAERLAYLRQSLNQSNITVTEIPIAQSPFSSLFVRFHNATQPLVIFSAHYDKLFDKPDYQGASDNTAAVSVMLASVAELSRRGDGGNRGFLFTGEEETGRRGASAFVEYARANKIAIREIVNFDNIGRGKLAMRPSASMPGFVFTLPLLGDYAFDGNTVRRFENPRTVETTARLTQALLRAQPDIVVYERFTAIGDSNVFQQSGIATVAISSDNMYYLEQTWHTYTDRVELLDERNLDRAFDLILKYGGK